MTKIQAITALDGRYSGLTHELAEIFSEYGLIKHRVQVEVEWLKFIIIDLKLVHGEDIDTGSLDLSPIDEIVQNFDIKDAEQVKTIEKKTNHDVKAIEYFIKDKLDKAGLSVIREWVHFACTSEDINNTAYALMLKKGTDMAKELLHQCIKKMEEKALAYKNVPMMSCNPYHCGKGICQLCLAHPSGIHFSGRKKDPGKDKRSHGKLQCPLFCFS
jgi:adenylosuccinate lyase